MASLFSVYFPFSPSFSDMSGIFKKLNHEPMVTLSSTKEARIYNGKKTASLTSGVGKTGQLLVKE